MVERFADFKRASVEGSGHYVVRVIPAQAGIQTAAWDSRLRGNDEPKNQRLTSHETNDISDELCLPNAYTLMSFEGSSQQGFIHEFTHCKPA